MWNIFNTIGLMSQCAWILDSEASNHMTTFLMLFNSQTWLHHKRLGHSSLNIIKYLFPYLFTEEFVWSFKCDICCEKHHYAS